MILYNASTSSGLRNYTRFLTNTNTTTYSDADLNANLNMWYHNVVNDILESMDGWDWQGEIATTDLVASQQEYTFPTDIIKVKRVEVSYNNGTNWYHAPFMDINERSGALDTTSIANDFSTSKPFVDIHDSSLFLFPIPSANSTGGLKIWYEKEATELSSDTDEPTFVEAYHKLLCYGAAKDYFEKYSEVPGNTNKRNLMKQELNQMTEDLKNHYNTKIQDREYVIKPAFVNYDYGSNN